MGGFCPPSHASTRLLTLQRDDLMERSLRQRSISQRITQSSFRFAGSATGTVRFFASYLGEPRIPPVGTCRFGTCRFRAWKPLCARSFEASCSKRLLRKCGREGVPPHCRLPLQDSMMHTCSRRMFRGKSSPVELEFPLLRRRSRRTNRFTSPGSGRGTSCCSFAHPQYCKEVRPKKARPADKVLPHLLHLQTCVQTRVPQCSATFFTKRRTAKYEPIHPSSTPPTSNAGSTSHSPPTSARPGT